ncbi:MAG: hypothetical protein HY787_10400 [Deltaproteobacteria bacterium]|nr:hypothetical protein [Deltaproteobacteria bacterium]
MISSFNPELLSFASRILEKQGGLVDYRKDQLFALLPQELARSLEIPEEGHIGGTDFPLIYGSPFLDRLIEKATQGVPIVYGQIELPYLKKAGFEQLIGRDLIFADGQIRIVSRAEARTTYMVLISHYLALSDERKEGLVRLTMHEESGSLIPDFEAHLPDFQVTFFEPGKIPPHFPVRLDKVVSLSFKKAQEVTEAELAEFFKSMERRLQRDIKNTREYFQSLEKEMKTALKTGRSEAHENERKAKIKALPQELARKIEDLQHKYQIQVTITGSAALRFLVPVVQLLLQIRYRKFERTARITWNPINRRLDPIICEQCSETIQAVYPWIKDSRIFLVCQSCSKRKNM